MPQFGSYPLDPMEQMAFDTLNPFPALMDPRLLFAADMPPPPWYPPPEWAGPDPIYSVPRPLDEQQTVDDAGVDSARRQRPRSRNRKRRSSDPTGQTWSDVESLIFADNLPMGPAFRSLDDGLLDTGDCIVPPMMGGGCRMDPYQDEWLFWDQLRKRRAWGLTPEEQQRWHEEKARRMLLWIHHSQALQSVDIRSHPLWWQVGC